MISTIAPYIGMGLVALGVAILYYLGTRDEKKSQKKSPIILPPGYKQK